MAHWCESCGQQLPTGAASDDATWLGELGADHEHTFTRPAGERKPGGEKRVLAVLALAALVWGAFIGIGRIVTPDDSIDDDVAADLEADRIDREVARALAEAEAEREAEEEARAAAANAAIAEDAADTEVGADANGEGETIADSDALIVTAAGRYASADLVQLQAELRRRGLSPRVAYESGNGVVILDLLAGDASFHVVADRLASAPAGSPVLRSGAASYSINVRTLEVTQVADDASLVVTDTLDGNAYFVDAKALSGQASLVEVVADGAYGFHRLPGDGFELLAVDGLGLLAVPTERTGATLIAGAESFEPLRSNRVVTGSAQAVLEEQCREDSTCALVLTNLETESQTAVPSAFVRFGDRFSLAPDGLSLMRVSPEGFAELFVADTGMVESVAEAGMQVPAWDSGSAFVAWTDLLGEPKLHVRFLDEGESLTIELRDFAAPGPATTAITIFAAAESSSEGAASTND